MKKLKLLLLILLIALPALCFGAIDIVYNDGDTFATFLKHNAWGLAATLFFLCSEWLGQTGKVKEGSIWAWIMNFVGKILRGKAETVKSKKAKFYLPKLLIIGLLLSGISTISVAQGHNRLFAPVENDFLLKMKANGTAVSNNTAWLPRIAAGMSAAQMYYDKESKNWTTSSLNAVCFGYGFQHFIQANDKPYNDYGFNILVLLDIKPTETTYTAFSTAATVSALEYLNFGGGYNFTLKKPFLLTTITFDIANLGK